MSQFHQSALLEEFALFYMDDGLLAGVDVERVQAAMTQIAMTFEKLGLEMNARKTQYVAMQGGILHQQEWSEVY